MVLFTGVVAAVWLQGDCTLQALPLYFIAEDAAVNFKKTYSECALVAACVDLKTSM